MSWWMIGLCGLWIMQNGGHKHEILCVGVLVSFEYQWKGKWDSSRDGRVEVVIRVDGCDGMSPQTIAIMQTTTWTFMERQGSFFIIEVSTYPSLNACPETLLWSLRRDTFQVTTENNLRKKQSVIQKMRSGERTSEWEAGDANMISVTYEFPSYFVFSICPTTNVDNCMFLRIRSFNAFKPCWICGMSLAL